MLHSTCFRVHVHVHVHAHVHVHVHVLVLVYVHVHVHVQCVRECARACVFVFAGTCEAKRNSNG